MKDNRLPARIEPAKVPRIWGRRWLHPLYPAEEELPEPVGEVWLTGKDCLFADGSFAGRKLGDAWRKMPKEWRGTRLASEPEFPLLAKFLFPELTLSIQVHPDDAYAAKHEAAKGGRGKTEMWYVVAAEPDAEMLVGLEEGTNQASLREAIEAGTIEQLLRRLPVSDGDTIFVPAGTVHTIGPGQVLCEVQEYSDLTYRLFDYHRAGAEGTPRELHIEQALAVVRLATPAAGKTQPIVRHYGPVEATYLAACRYFAVERWRFIEPFNLRPSKEHFDLFIFIGGEGEIVTGENRRPFHHGDVWFVPADVDRCWIEPTVDSTLLRAYVPDLQALKRKLLQEGVSGGELDRFLFE